MRSNYGGMPALTPVAKNLIIVNVLCFLLSAGAQQFFGFELESYLSLHLPDSALFRPFQFVTYMFMHGDFFHLLFNMFALFMFGRELEQLWGPKRFLMFYLLCGVAGAAPYILIEQYHLHGIQAVAADFANNPSPAVFQHYVDTYWSNPGAATKQWAAVLRDFAPQFAENPLSPDNIAQAKIAIESHIEHVRNVPMLGASGAVYGILLGFGMMFPNAMLLMLFIPIRAKYMVMLYAGIEIYLGLKGTQDNIAHMAHLGGMLVGLCIILYWHYTHKKR